MVADILIEAKTKRAAKTRIAARCSVNNNFMNTLVDIGFLVEGPRRSAIVTEKGTEFLLHFQALQKLCPRPPPEPSKREEEIPFAMR